MKVFFANLWNDPAAFRAAVRSVVVLISGLITSGVIVFPVGSRAAWFAALFTGPIALAFPAGATNLSPGVVKAMARDPEIVVSPKDVVTVEAAKASK